MSKTFKTRGRQGAAGRWKLFGTTVLALVAFAVVFAAASGADLTGSTFESTDGNLVVNGVNGTDWANVAGLKTAIDQSSGSADNAFGQGTAEDDSNVTIVDGSIPPNKNDLTRSYLASETVGTNTFLYLAWERAVNTGDANLDFELDQNATAGWDGSTTGALTINRTAGDLLFTYDFGGSGTPTLGLNFWLTSAHGDSASDCTKSNSLPCWGKHVTLSPSGTPAADGAVNTGDVTDAITSPAVGTLTAGLFGEAAVNLSAIPGVFSANTCKAFGSEFVKSRSSSSFDAELKDFIAPGPIHVSNCGSIELKKHWVGTAGSATLKIGTTAGASDTASKTVTADDTTGAKAVENGNQFVSETVTNAADYTSTLSCTDNDGTPFDPGAGAIPVNSNHTVVCTFTNTRKTGTIKLQKHWVGTAGNASLAIGSAGPGSANVATGSANGADGSAGPATVDTGTYYVSEQFDSNLYTTSLACFNDANNNGVNDAGDSAVSVGANDSVAVGSGLHVICTYTNTRKTGTLEVKKVLNPTSDTGTFDLTIDATSFTNNGAGFGNNGTTGQIAVDTGSHSASEAGHGTTALSDYVSSYSCSNGASGNGTSIAGITVNAGDHVLCTFTNARKPKLTIVKTVTNDNGGSAAPTAWLLSATGAGNDPNSFSGQGGAGPHVVTAGVAYTLAESGGPSGYTAGSFTCNGGSLNGSAVTLSAGQNVTCTINNNDNAPGLHLRKTVTNDNGGTALPAAWTLTATGSFEGATNLSGHSPVDSAGTFKAGTYALAESDGPSGYTAGAWSCDGGTQNGASITVALGQSVTCTINNNDNAPSLHLIKTVTNDDGGTALATAWTLHADGAGTAPTNLSGSTPVDSTGTFKADTYTLSESGGPSDYTASNWSCDGGTQVGNKISVALGDDVTCTIVNDDDAPTVTVEKRVLPSGDAGTFKFSLSQGGHVTVLDNGTDGYGDGDSTGQVDVSAGDLGISESGNGSTDGSLYASSWSCSSNRERSASGAGTSISLAGLQLGENVTCTFTNTRLATLIVKKVVDNSNGGGSKGPGDFSLHVTTGGLELPGSPAAGSSSGTTYAGLLPGTYKVSEDAVSGYNLTKIEGCLADGSVSLAAGATVTCTLTNTSNAPPPPPPPPPPAPKVDLQITKSAAPNPAVLGNQVTWTMVVTNNGPNNATGVTLADPVPAGMSFVSVASSQGTCTGGALVSCTLGNLNVGASVTITLVTTSSVTGTIVNTVTTVAKEQETNTANNTASASVVVNGPFVPPAKYCTAVAVSPKSLFVGRRNTLTIKVSQHGKAKAGVKVRVKGSTISLVSKPSNHKGVVKQTVKPMKAGIIVFSPVASQSCKNPRVGVIGVFTPPVTG